MSLLPPYLVPTRDDQEPPGASQHEHHKQNPEGFLYSCPIIEQKDGDWTSEHDEGRNKPRALPPWFLAHTRPL